MVREAKAKIAALALSAACIAIELFHVHIGFRVEGFGICKGSPLLQRLTYHFFHANIIHASINAWCILTLAFIYHTTITELFLAYAIAATYPIDAISSACCSIIPTTPTVGMSAICFALMGQTFYRVRHKWYYTACVFAIIANGFMLPQIAHALGTTIAQPNYIIHIYCYVVGLMVGFFNSPIPSHAN